MINTFLFNFGYDNESLRKVIEDKFKKNADILIGIDDPEILQLIDVIVDSFVQALIENNNKIKNDMEQYVNNQILEYFRKYVNSNIY